MTCERVDDVTDPRLDVFRNLKPRNAERDAGVFVAEGPTVVERLLRSRCRVQSLLITDRKLPAFQTRLPGGVPVFIVNDEQARALIGFEFHAGVLASAVRPVNPPLDSLPVTSETSLLVAGERITDPENVGALIRIASAFGASAVVLGKGSADPYSRRVLRVSMGNGLFLPVHEVDDLPGTLQSLTGRQNYHTVATVLDAASVSLTSTQFASRTVLVFGNEYDGLSPSVLAACQRRLTISMLNGTDSLNIAVAAGICLHEFRRQWPGAGS
jgi:tRNA G18 (ribose-2'-O)-methylase SpoU